MSAIGSQLGVKDETTYATGVVVDRFYQLASYDVETTQVRLRPKQIRASGWAPLSSQQRVAIQGGTLACEMEWMSKGMGWWLKHLVGATATGSPSDSAYTHTGTIGSLWGDFFTAQVDAPFHPSGTSQALTLEGCKVASWELKCSAPEDLMTLSMEIDAAEVVTGTALASASYPSGIMPYGWIDVACTIAGSAVTINSWSIKCNNNLDLERYHQRSSAIKLEPTHNGFREIEFEIECDFDSLTQYNRVRATASADATKAVVLTATMTDTGALIGSATNPSTTITIDAASFDEITGLGKDEPTGTITQTLSGVGLWDGTDSPLTIAYVSADSTA